MAFFSLKCKAAAAFCPAAKAAPPFLPRKKGKNWREVSPIFCLAINKTYILGSKSSKITLSQYLTTLKYSC